MNTHLRNRLLMLFVALVVLTGLLALDLKNEGLAWQIAWELTGEEEAIGQMRGMIEYAVTLTRPRPQTHGLVPIQHTGANPYGINTFLHLEVEEAKVEAQVQMVKEAGFGWIRQQFEWAEIEVDGRGQFTDSRNDMDGDGTIDTISGWRKFDRIVDLADQHGLQIQARLDNPPNWARSQNPDIGEFAPPDDYQDYVNFAVAVAERYKGRIHHYQVWNEPNIYPEWGRQPVNPEAYTEMLCRTYAALKAVDPEIVVITGALAATIELNNLNIHGGTNLQDFVFLQRMYDAGAGECFDVLSIQAYGLWSGPTDQRMRPTTVNIARNLYIRDLMVANGDEHKPIWISEAAWNAVPSESEYPEAIEARYNFGQVTLEQQARYAPLFYQRAQEEWPWIGVINYWFFTRPSDLERGQSFYYFRMVEPDYSTEKPTYTPLPVYNSLKDYITSQTPTLYQGVHQAEGHWAIAVTEGQTLEQPGAVLDVALRASALDFVVHGTDANLRWTGAERIILNGEAITGQADAWNQVTLLDARLPQTRSIRVEGAAIYDTVTVRSRPYEKLFNWLAPAGIGLFVLLFVGVDLLLQRRRKGQSNGER